MDMIVTRVTVKGHEHSVFLTRAENPVRLIIERSVYPNGAYKVRAGELRTSDSLDALYSLLGPLLYGTIELDNFQRAELENLIRPMLRA